MTILPSPYAFLGQSSILGNTDIKHGTLYGKVYFCFLTPSRHFCANFELHSSSGSHVINENVRLKW